jgi:hypothetical protein
MGKKNPGVTAPRLGLRLEGKDREIRAKDFAEMAIDTIVFLFSLRIIIAFGIEGLGHPEYVARAVFDTELAALAPLLDHCDPTLRDLNGLQIEWNAPVFHLRPFARAPSPARLRPLKNPL